MLGQKHITSTSASWHPTYQQRIAFQIFVISLLATILASIVLNIMVRREVRHDRENILAGSARQLTRAYESLFTNWLDQFAQLNGVMASRLPTEPILKSDPFLKDLVYNEIFNRFPFEHILLIDGGDNKVLEEVRSHLGDDQESETSSQGQIQIGSLLSQAVLQLNKNGNVQPVSGVSCRDQSSLFPEDPKPQSYLVLMSPITFRESSKSKHSPVILLAFINCIHLLDPVRSSTDLLKVAGFRTAEPYLVDSDNDTVIASPDRGKIGKKLTQDFSSIKGYTSVELQRALKATVKPTTQDENTQEPTILHYNVNGAKDAAIALLDPVGDRVVENGENLRGTFAWRIVVGIKEDDMYQMMKGINLWFIVAPLSISFAVLLASLASSRFVEVSLVEFTHLINEASQGKVSHLVASNGSDEIGKLGEALNALLVSVKRKEPFSRINNPYVVGNPIRTNNMFFGRHDDLRWIAAQLQEPTNKFISLVGQRRIGKTSMLHQIRSSNATHGAFTFFFDTQELLPQISSEVDFYRILKRDILRQLRSQKKTKAPFIVSDSQGPESLRKLISDLARSDCGMPVFLFDEIDNFDTKFQRGQLNSDNILMFFSGILESAVRVCFVSTASERSDFSAERWSVLSPKMVTRRLGLLGDLDAKRLVKEPVRGFVLYEEKIVEKILRLTAGHPYYTQAVCQHLVDHLNEVETSVAGPTELDDTIRFILSNPPQPLDYFWANQSPHAKAGLSALAHLLADDHSAVPVAEVVKEIRVLVEDECDEALIRSSIAHLRNEDWLEEPSPDHFRFKIDLLRQWLERYHSIFSVAAEGIESQEKEDE